MDRGSNRGQAEAKPTATFVKTDATNFKDIVQLLTGQPDQTKSPHEPGTATPVPSPKRTTASRNRPKLHIVKPYSRPADRFTSPSKSRESASTVPSPGTTPSPREFMGGLTPDQKTSRNRPSLQITPPVPYFGPRNSSFSDLSPSRSSNFVGLTSPGLSPSPRELMGGPTPNQKTSRNRPSLQITPPVPYFGPRNSSFSDLSPCLSSNFIGLTSPGLSPTSKFSQLSLMPESSGESPDITMVNKDEEDNAVKAGRVYIHPSPRSPTQPELLDLFPLTSPREAISDPGASITRAPKSLSL